MNKAWSALSLLTANRLRTRGDAAAGAVYLSFDDGPHPQHTEPLLDLLAQHGAKATFFLLGQLAQAHPAIVRRILAEGHAIGNHSMTHPRMPALGAASQWAEIRSADAVLAQFDGRPRHPFRPPNGRVTLAGLAACLWRWQPLVLWSIDSQDYCLGPDDVIQRLQARPMVDGDVLLFHDDGACAGQALRVLLPLWRQAGCRFRALA